ncbi:hypothetical protein MOV08_43140 [Streptomyces yunnanensis]|uniref:Sigma-70 region 2 n=1 Tax=Streptomyces yunnanensis TaxID=156453 RepID=A0ABY8APJ9_9ACTN|nr:hypothetical protein [Streptomyces yunnanensis]WEB45417.1 hypothetical protein MOV08_43140 [Streptomyces yunnanensis]
MDAVQPTLVTRLNTEWEWLCADRGNAERVRSWMLTAGVLEEDQAPAALGQLCALLRERSDRDGPEFNDAWMGVLLHRVNASDGREAELAARVLVQTMLPCAQRMMRRCLRDGESSEDVAQLVIASLWEVVRSYPVARRPRQVATNLRMELWHRVSRELKQELAPSAALDEEWAAQFPGGDEAGSGRGRSRRPHALGRLSDSAAFARAHPARRSRGEPVCALPPICRARCGLHPRPVIMQGPSSEFGQPVRPRRGPHPAHWQLLRTLSQLDGDWARSLTGRLSCSRRTRLLRAATETQGGVPA